MAKTQYIDRLVNAREATHLLGISNTTLYKFCREGKLNPVKFSRRCTRFRVSDIQALICANQEGGQQ